MQDLIVKIGVNQGVKKYILRGHQIICDTLGGRGGVSKNVTKCHIGGGGLANVSRDIFQRFFQ